MTKIFHPLLALIASATDRKMAKYVQFLKEENKILRSRVKGQVHTKPEELERLLKFEKAIGRGGKAERRAGGGEVLRWRACEGV